MWYVGLNKTNLAHLGRTQNGLSVYPVADSVLVHPSLVAGMDLPAEGKTGIVVGTVMAHFA